VTWISAGDHTVEADDASFDSGALAAGKKFQHKFENVGDFRYHCAYHGDKGGSGMSGIVHVRK
jgi:plastocyanin